LITIDWKPQAWQDLEAIEEYYLKVAPQYGVVFVDEVLSATRQLERSPQLGRIVPEIGDSKIREIFYRSYRIIYFYEEDSEIVEILTIYHGARQFGGL
jgi:plasmid stabilization system protein ParE